MKYNLVKPINPAFSLTQQIFFNRNVSDIESFTNPSVSSLHDELLLNNIVDGAELLLKHLKDNNNIFIQVDSDCDGYTSSAILLNWIYSFNKESYKNITYRIHDGKQHGLLDSTLEDLSEKNIKLVIIPDAGSNQLSIHTKLLEMGIDCIVIDHHESDVLDSPAIIINPKLDSYPNKELSGAGVVYKFCKVLDKIAQVNLSDDFLDLVALGMIADMMNSTVLETRRLILMGINNIKNGFLEALIQKQAYSMRNEITPTTIGFYIAPLINATVRAGTTEEKEIIFSAFLNANKDLKEKSTKRGSKEFELESRVDLAARIVTNIKSRQTKMRNESIKKIEKIIEERNLTDNKIIIVVLEDELDKNLSGLVANKLMDKYKRPVVILRKTRDDLLQGSARGYERSDIQDFKEFVNNTELVEYAEGHANAFGISIREDNVDSFIDQTNKELENVELDSIYLVDYIFNSKTLQDRDIFEIYDLRNLWGKGFEEPVFCIEKIRLNRDDIALLSQDKNPTLKLTYKNINLIKFGASIEEFESLLPKYGDFIEIDVVGRFSVNEWNGNQYPQILIEDYKKKKEMQYYF